MTDVPMATRRSQNKRMKAMSLDDRVAAIDAAPNVLGYDRFCDRAKQVQLREVYRRPIAPAQ